MTVRPAISALLAAINTPKPLVPPHEEVLTVSPATRRIAFAYERFRNTLEPDEADILRRKAIARILERRLPEGRPPLATAEALLQELMRANYVPAISKPFALHASRLISRAQQVYDRLPRETAAWLVRIVAVSLDRDLFPSAEAEALVTLMYQDTFSRTEWVDSLVDEKDRPTQLYLACHRALYEADDYEIAYHYFIHHFPAWHKTDFTPADLEHFLKELPLFYRRIDAALRHPARVRLARVLRPVAVPYRLARDVMLEGGEALTSPEVLAEATRSAVTKRTTRLKERMNKRAWHSVLFLFFTKTIIAFIVEVPYELLLLNALHWGALAINVVFHPLLLLFLTATARLPGRQNTERIVEEVQKIISGEEVMPTIIVRAARRYGAVTWSFFAVFYVAMFFVIFWGLFYLLDLLQFSLIAMVMFVIFLGLVSFLAIRIRRSIDQIRVLPFREGALGSLFTFLSLPVLEFGRWLAENISQLNIALFLMDRVLEAPFKILIDIIEEWFTFVRDRRDEIV